MKNWQLNRFLKGNTSNDCIGPCSSSMIRSGQCMCKNPAIGERKSDNPLFTFRYWMITAFVLCLSSWIFGMNWIVALIVIIGTYIYFTRFRKKNSRF